MQLQLGRRLGLLIAFSIIGLSTSFGAGKDSINVKRFGATGDGRTDDYNALLKVVSYINEKGGGIVYFPKGTYYIGRYHTKGDSIPDLMYQNCKGLDIVGDQAKILLNGGFVRTADYSLGKHTFSYNNAIIPFYFKNCSNVRIRGFEIDGGVGSMRRDNGVAERGGYLVDVMECDHVIIQNMNLHHAQTDGVVISGRAMPSTNILMENVVSANNARQGMSIGNAVGALFVNCKFLRTGQTGAYGMHSPGAGVDIEPGTLTNNQRTSNITFRNCLFEDNQGGQFLVSSPQFTSEVKLANCTLNAVNSTCKYQMILSADGVTIDSCTIDCGNGSIYPRWGGAVGARTAIMNSTIKSGGSGIIAISNNDADNLTIIKNKIICTSEGPLQSYFPYLRVRNMKFNQNQVVLRAGSLKMGRPASMIENGIESSGNSFQTERNNIKPQVSYKGTSRVLEQ